MSSPSLPHHPMVKKIPEASDSPMMTPSEYRSSNNISRPPSSYNPSSVSNPADSRSINIYGVDFDTSGPLSQNHAHHHHGGSLSNHGNNGSLDRDMSDFSPSNGSSALDDRRMRRTRTFIDPTSEIPRLEQWFMMTSHPSRSQIERFTEELNKLEYRRKFPRLEAKNLQFWFKNRRAKQKRLTSGSTNPVHLMNGPLSTGPLSSSSSSGHNHSPPPPPSSVSPILSSGSHHHSLVQSHHHHINPLSSSAHALSSSSAHALSSASATNLLHHHLSQTLNSNVVDLSVSSSSNQISPSSNHHNQTPSPRDANNRDANNRDANNRDANILNNNNNHSKNMSIRAPSPDHSESASQSPIPMNGPILAPSGIYPSFDTKQQSITKNGANFIK